MHLPHRSHPRYTQAQRFNGDDDLFTDRERLRIAQCQNMCTSPNARGSAGVKSTNTAKLMSRCRIDKDAQHAIKAVTSTQTRSPSRRRIAIRVLSSRNSAPPTWHVSTSILQPSFATYGRREGWPLKQKKKIGKITRTTGLDAQASRGSSSSSCSSPLL